MIGQTISHYRISAELGRGGMGVVYRAHDERLLRSVAIKILSDATSGSAQTRSRILAEARAASNLQHPGITTIYEVGEDGESIFLVMELVEGRTLRSLLASGPLEPRQIIEIGAQLAESLQAAHSRGVFHGDIKPENIVVQADGRTKLLDFGVARQGIEDAVTKTLTTAVESTATPGIQGTLAYLAPEQLRCEPADGRADLYSLGVVIYELAGGTPALHGAHAYRADVANSFRRRAALERCRAECAGWSVQHRRTAPGKRRRAPLPIRARPATRADAHLARLGTRLFSARRFGWAALRRGPALQTAHSESQRRISEHGAGRCGDPPPQQRRRIAGAPGAVRLALRPARNRSAIGGAGIERSYRGGRQYPEAGNEIARDGAGLGRHQRLGLALREARCRGR